MVILITGVSGSGKSTIGKQLADSLQWQFADGDDFHPPENIVKMREHIPLTDGDRRPWLLRLQTAIDEWLNTDQNVVLACSALKQSYRQMLLRDPQKMQLVYLKGSAELIAIRLQHRPNHFMPPDLLNSQFETLEEPTKAIAVDISLAPEQIIEQIKTALSVNQVDSNGF